MNNFAITSAGLGEAMTRSASALDLAGNTIQETAGMITGITEVTQDPEKAGNALKVLSLRLRGMKGQLQELGEETDENVENISKMQGQILNMTKGKVNIFDATGNFKSTYEIMKGIAEVWDDLNSTAQADLLETIAGKHRANDVASLLANWQNVEAAVKSASEAEGSAARENAKYIDSIQGRLDKLTTAWQSFANTFMESDFLKGAISGLTTLVEIIEKLVDSIGTLGTIGLGAGIFAMFKNKGLFAGILGDLSVLPSLFADAWKSGGNLIGRFKGVGDAAKQAGGSIAGRFTGSLSGMIGGIGLAIAAIGLIVNAYKNYREEISEARQETIRSSDEFLDAAGSFEQAYIKYSGRTDLTAEEESELEAAIQGTVDALGDKSSALQNAVNSSNDYVASLERITKAELEAANRAAKEKRDNAALELQDAVKGWASIDGSEVDIELGRSRTENLSETNKAVKIATQIGEKYYGIGSYGKDDDGKIYSLTIKADASVDEILDYYHTLEKIKAELVDEGLTGTEQYEKISQTIEKMSESVKVYEEGLYDAAKAQYQLANGIPKTTDAYLKMRESILNEVGGTLDTRKAIAGTLDSEYGQMFDLTTPDVQARKLIGVLDKYGDAEATQMETFLNMRTAVNNNECTVGDYISQFDDINKMTEGWSDNEKEELNTSFGLDSDTIKHQYDEVVKHYMRTFKVAKRGSDGVFENFVGAVQGNISGIQEQFEGFLDGLSASELSAVYSLKAEIDWENDSWDNILKQIEEEAKLIEAISFSVNLELEAEKLENLSTAISESISGAGLGTESMSLVEDMFGDLDGYDQSLLFERTANGIRLNSDELRKLNEEYKQTNVDGLDDKIDALGERYLQCREELSNLTYGTKEYNDKARELEDIEAQINATEKLAAQYKGLTSAYQTWQRVEASGSHRDMYESMIEGLENIDDEMSRGWIDDGTIEFLRLIYGDNISAVATTKELKEAYKDLGKTIEGTSYSVRDFFTVNEDGDSTNAGVYNFLEAVDEKLGGNEIVKRNDKGKIVSFDFKIAGGDKAIAEALGISEELVQIMKRAADDAGFVVSMDGTYQQLDVLKEKAQEAANKLKDTFKKTKFEFNLNTSSEDSVLKQYQEAMKIWEEFKKNKNADGTINMDVEGAEEAYTLVSTLQSMVDKLSEPAYMKIDSTQVEKDMQTPLSKLQEYETLVQAEHQLRLKGTDTTEIENSKKEILDYFDNLKANQPEIAAKLGIDKLSREEIQAKVEAGEIKIPATIDLQVEMNNTLKDMVNVALYNAGLVDKEELEKRVDIKVYADKIDTSNVEEKTEDAVENNGEIKAETKKHIEIIAETFGVEDVDDLTSKLNGLDDKTIQAIAEVLGRADVDLLQNTMVKLKPKTVEAIAKAIGKGDVEGLKDAIINIPDKKHAQAIAEAFGYDDVNALAAAVGNLNPKTVQAIAQALGISDVNTLQVTINNMQGNTVKAKVDTDGQAGKVNTLQIAIDGMQGNTVKAGVNTDGQAGKVDSLQSKINSLKGKIVNVGVQLAAGGKSKAAQRTGADPDGKGTVNGTANVNGTTGRAFARGDWRTKKTETALVGEIGREIVVTPENRWYTVGDAGAEFTKIPKGSIVFNHKQTEELLRNGKVTSGGGRAKALVNGTAFLGGTAYPGGTTDDEPMDKVEGSSDNSDKFEETFDWLNILLSRLERTIDNLDKTVSDSSKSWTTRNNALADEITKVGNLIGTIGSKEDDDSIAGKYWDKAGAILDHDSVYAKKIRALAEDGTFDIKDFNIQDFIGEIDEDTLEKIKGYQKWYELYLDMIDKAEDLKQTEAELYQQRFDNVMSEYDGILQGFEHTESMLNEYINQAEAKGHIVSKNYYQALINNEKSNIAELQKEQADLIAKRDKAVASGAIVKGSQAWYDMCAEIDGVTQAIEEGNTAIIEYNNAIRDIEFENFELAHERMSELTSEAEFLIELMSNKKLHNDDGSRTNYGDATLGLLAQNYHQAMYEADDYGAKAADILRRMNMTPEDEGYEEEHLDPLDQNNIDKYYEYLDLQRESILNAEDQKQAMKDLISEGYDKELEALQERIDLHNEELDSMKDLYDYQKNVQEQTENIASLQKQLYAYEGFDDEETRATVQKLKVELEKANADLKETEFDRYLSQQEELLTSLYEEYELTLNTRLDDLDGLVEDVFTAVEENAVEIGKTLFGEDGASGVAGSVGAAVSDELKAIWTEGGVGNKLAGSVTTIQTILEDIKKKVVGEDGMVGKSNEEATDNINQPKTDTSANQNPTGGSSGGSKPPSSSSGGDKPTGGDGKVQIGDKVKFLKGKYYYDSQGVNPAGSKYQGKYVYVTNVNNKSWATHPIHISAGKKLGDKDLGWLTRKQIGEYATGKKNFLNDETAWTQENGQEFIVRPSDGAILTPIAKGDSVLTSAASNNIWDMANSPAEFIKDNLRLDAANVPNNSNVSSVYNQTIENVTFDFKNVKNYEEMLYALRDDRRFEKLVTAMTIDRVAGKSNLTKGKSIR